uniref:C2H2 type zinc-finger protein n=1 Tax=Siphoviridae sp. ctCsv15 TaxID=2826195 RepID=A0A8S5LYU9_9CAUD|nr:MAG TPA: C2H2 type zinc-finger protein [Siphoviridae sp. ctCsv15]
MQKSPICPICVTIESRKSLNSWSNMPQSIISVREC